MTSEAENPVTPPPAERPEKPPAADRPSADATARAIALTKSYTGPAVLSFLLFFTPCTWVIGMFIAWRYRADARRMEAIAGDSLPGAGLLNLVYWVGVVSIAIWVILILMMTLGGE